MFLVLGVALTGGAFPGTQNPPVALPVATVVVAQDGSQHLCSTAGVAAAAGLVPSSLAAVVAAVREVGALGCWGVLGLGGPSALLVQQWP